MNTISEERRAEIVKLLREAVDMWADAVMSGRYGFDNAINEYVEQTDNELSRAFAGYIPALQANKDVESSEKTRRRVLTEIAEHFNVPELTALVAALLEAQDRNLSLAQTLKEQAELLQRT